MPPLPKKFLQKQAGEPAERGPKEEQAPRAGMPWMTDKYTTVLMQPGDQKRRVPCHLLGALAVHRAICPDSGYALTSATTGLLICLQQEFEDAKKIGEVLWVKYARALLLKDEAKINEMIPKWVKQWVRACRILGLYVEPDQYQEDK